MRSVSYLLGLSGISLTVFSWSSSPPEASWGAILTLALCALGGLVPARLPGFEPMPVSLPLIGAMAVTSGATEAMMAGLFAGLATALAPGRRKEDEPEPWADAFALGGALALAAGAAASGFGRLGLSAVFPFTPSAPAPEDAMRSLLVMTTAMFLAREAARLGTGGPAAPWRRIPITLTVASGCGIAAMVLASAVQVWGVQPVNACLACAGMTSLLLSWRIMKLRLEVRSADRRARTGSALVEAIALAIEAKDRTSERHLRRMRVYALQVGRRLGMSASDLESLEHAAVLHDIGKLVVPESILSKPSVLTPDEFQMMSTHARVGAEILETTRLSSGVAKMVRHHHERYDGSGYPDGLVGMEIPLGARILAAVDAFEAMTSQRPYRPGVPAREAVAFLERQAGAQFDPRVVRVLVEHHQAFERLVVQEEKANDGARVTAAPRSIAGDADTRKVSPPFQAVLDRIASSHMEIYSLHEISRTLGQTLDLDESFGLIVGRIRRLIDFSACVVYVLQHDAENLRPRYAEGTGAARMMELTIPLGQKVSGWAALQRRPCCGGTTASDLELVAGDAELAQLKTSLAVPLIVGESLVGVIALYDASHHEYSRQEEHLLALMAHQVAGAIRTGLLFEQTQEQTLTDSLTGLPNSRYMFIAFEREATRAREENTSLTLMVMDIDNFREINDDFGHHAGDRFLVGMARAIRSEMRVCDTCIRYAGDEFVAILPGIGPEEIETVVERLAEAASDYCMEARPGRPVKMSLSVGWATMPVDGGDFESIIKVATARMMDRRSRHRGGAGSRTERVPFGALMRGRGN